MTFAYGCVRRAGCLWHSAESDREFHQDAAPTTLRLPRSNSADSWAISASRWTVWSMWPIRTADRVQVFSKQGVRLLRNCLVAPQMIGRGSAWTIAFSHDPYAAEILIGWRRSELCDLDSQPKRRHHGGQIRPQGSNAGQFNFIRDIALDSRGDLYTGEVNTNFRLQKFVLEK